MGTPSHLGHMDRVAATMPSQVHAGAAQEAPDIGQWEGQDVPLVRPSSCNVKGGIPSSRRYLPTYLPPRHSWLRFPGAVPRHSWLGSAGGGGVRLPTTPGWGLPVVVVCFAGGGVPCCVCLWFVWLCALAPLCCVLRVCGVCVVGGVVWWCGGCVFRVCRCAWLPVCGVPVVCGLVSPPLSTPGRGAWLRGTATPGWGPPPGAVVGPSLAVGRGRGSPPLLAGIHWFWWWGPLVCVCALCGPSCWCGWRGGGRARCGCRTCAVCACGVWLVRCVIPWLVLVVSRHGRVQKAEEEVL